ncbi:MAG: Holliday junction resolvase RuvX [Clostridia bacterium]|nr:Holliday junction resolvase RuvX [Clostridia bacterium]MBQ9994095.1 Holliday junction resolvase RuvX [Clostridia bacterium]
MIIMSVDLGKARTGLAICDSAEMLSSPLTVIEQYNREKLLGRICEIASERRAERIVVGLPRNMDNSEGDSALGAREFADALREASGIEVVMQDERCTTVTAHHYLNQTDTRGKKRKAVIDAVAATIILQDHLDWRKNNEK